MRVWTRQADLNAHRPRVRDIVGEHPAKLPRLGARFTPSILTMHPITWSAWRGAIRSGTPSAPIIPPQPTSGQDRLCRVTLSLTSRKPRRSRRTALCKPSGECTGMRARLDIAASAAQRRMPFIPPGPDHRFPAPHARGNSTDDFFLTASSLSAEPWSCRYVVRTSEPGFSGSGWN